MGKTYRRDYLRKRIEKGEVEGRLAYSYSEHSGVQKGEEWMPVEFGDHRKPGVIVFTEHDLGTSTGRAYWDDREEGLLTLVVHSNLFYDLRIIDPSERPERMTAGRYMEAVADSWDDTEAPADQLVAASLGLVRQAAKLVEELTAEQLGEVLYYMAIAHGLVGVDLDFRPSSELLGTWEVMLCASHVAECARKRRFEGYSREVRLQNELQRMAGQWARVCADHGWAPEDIARRQIEPLEGDGDRLAS